MKEKLQLLGRKALIPMLAVATFAMAPSLAMATPPEPPTIDDYLTTVNIDGLIQEGGSAIANIVAAVIVVVFAFLVVRIGVRWMRGAA